MGELYYYMWEFVTSVTIIILVAAYIIHDRLKLRYEKIEDEIEKKHKTQQPRYENPAYFRCSGFFRGDCLDRLHGNPHHLYQPRA